MKNFKKSETEIRNLDRTNPREAAVQELGDRLNEIALIYDPSIAIHSMTSLTLNYAVRYEMDKKVFMKAVDEGFDLIKEELDRSLKEKQEKK